MGLKAAKTLCLMLSSSSRAAYPVPVEAKPESVQLLPHRLYVTEARGTALELGYTALMGHLVRYTFSAAQHKYLIS